MVLVSDSARRESSARSSAGSIGWVVHFKKPSYSFFLLSTLKYLLGTDPGLILSSFISYDLISKMTAHGPILGHIDQR